MRVLEVYWSWALSHVGEVALKFFPDIHCPHARDEKPYILLHKYEKEREREKKKTFSTSKLMHVACLHFTGASSWQTWKHILVLALHLPFCKSFDTVCREILGHNCSRSQSFQGQLVPMLSTFGFSLLICSIFYRFLQKMMGRFSCSLEAVIGEILGHNRLRS